MLSEKVKELNNLWLNQMDDKTLIDDLKNAQNDEEEINDRFYRDLAFGTAGLRGILGAGTNRMNIYTVARATQGLADYLNDHYASSSVAISYDSRINSSLFAKTAASVLAANGVMVHIMPELMPTPILSFAVRELKCQSGIMVTASHNPSKYNGYKCYGSDGGQMTEKAADEVTAKINSHAMFHDVKQMNYDEAVQEGLIKVIEDSLIEKFMNCALSQQINPGICKGSQLSVVYTPLNGTGNKPVRKILQTIGMDNVLVVPEQENPDGNFPTCPYPNPEFKESLEYALKLAEDKKADIVLATDPDCDRVGMAVRDGDHFTLLSGNEVGCLLMNYILSCRKENGTLPEHPVVVSTIVSSKLTKPIAEKYGVEIRYVLTGFKYIGEQISLLAEQGCSNRFLFGFEESYGYMSGDYCRDKDGVVTSMLVCEMASYYHSKGKTLLDVLNGLFKEFGVYRHEMLNITFEGEKGMIAMKELMDHLRSNYPTMIAGKKVLQFSDYLESYSKNLETGNCTEIFLPKSNVLVFDLEDGASVIFRPSGTEPKVKSYITATGKDAQEAASLAKQIQNEAEKLIKG